MSDDAEIVFMPYNYLVDTASRRQLASLWPNAVVIFDEAHNLSGICAEASSFDIRAGDIAQSIKEVNCNTSQTLNTESWSLYPKP
jgi:regulator of telomere elongation helicase 1